MAAQDKFSKYKPLNLLVARSGFEVIPHDINELPFVSTKLYVGTAGNIKVLMVGDSIPITLKNVPLGLHEGLAIKQIFATGTTAADIVAFV